MEQISIRVKIAERYYPLKIQAKDEEQVRKAAKMINEKISHYMQTFTTADKQDALAMCAVEMTAGLLQLQDMQAQSEEAISHEINEVSQLLNL